jgi:hypothetical protein
MDITAAASAMYAISDFICLEQRKVIRELVYGEEGQFFADKLVELQGIIENMPKTYETEGLPAEKKLAQLHYFKGGWDWYIIEKDIENDQLQAFGVVKGDETECRYISIQELMENGVEIDLHFTPTPYRELL